MLSTLVQPLLQCLISLQLQLHRQSLVPIPSLASVLEVLLHRLEGRVVLWNNWLLVGLLLRVSLTLEHVPLVVVGRRLAVEQCLGLLPVLPLGSSDLFLGFFFLHA